jgi:ATP-dependent protease HslVU (ClpYQ) ATPase subunit
MTSLSPREIVSELDRFIAQASGSEAVSTPRTGDDAVSERDQ